MNIELLGDLANTLAGKLKKKHAQAIPQTNQIRISAGGTLASVLFKCSQIIKVGNQFPRELYIFVPGVIYQDIHICNTCVSKTEHNPNVSRGRDRSVVVWSSKGILR